MPTNLERARVQLFLGQLLGMLVLTLLLLCAAYLRFRQELYDLARQEVQMVGKAVVFSVEFDKRGQPEFEESIYLSERADSLSPSPDLTVIWMNRNQNVVRQRGHLRVLDRPATDGDLFLQAWPPAYVFTLEVRDKQGISMGFTRVAVGLGTLQKKLHQILAALTIWGVVTMILASGALWLWSGRVLKPLREQYRQMSLLTGAISHELRSPLTAIRVNCQGIQLNQDRLSSHELRQCLIELEDSSRQMVQLLDGLMILASHHQQPNSELVVDLDRLVREIAEGFSSVAQERGLTITVATQPTQVKGLDSHFRLVARNLIDNALRYTPTGGAVSIEVHPEYLEISDNGVGIPLAEHKRIFEPFWRADFSRSRHQGGSGLGLAIVHHIAQLQGAAIEVDSEIGKGSRFRYRLSRD